MLRYALAIFVTLVVLSFASPWLRRLGLGRLPGDFQFRLFGREWSLPFSSTLVLSALMSVIVRWL
jgi:hypothetical protein